MPRPRPDRMHTSAKIPLLGGNLRTRIRNAKELLKKAKIEKSSGNPSKAKQLRDNALKLIEETRQGIQETIENPPEKQEPPTLTQHYENEFSRRFSRGPIDIIDFYKRLKLPKEIVIKLEFERLRAMEKKGSFLPDWKKIQIIEATLKALGI